MQNLSFVSRYVGRKRKNADVRDSLRFFRSPTWYLRCSDVDRFPMSLVRTLSGRSQVASYPTRQAMTGWMFVPGTPGGATEEQATDKHGNEPVSICVNRG